MIGALLGDLWPYLAAAGAAIAAFLGAYLKGRRDASQKAAQRAADSYIKTRKRADEEDYIDDDFGVIRDRLRERGKR